MDRYGKLIDGNQTSDNYDPYAQQQQYQPPGAAPVAAPAGYNPNVGFSVPVQVGYGGYTQDVNVPMSFNADGYGQPGRMLAAQMQPGSAGHLPPGRWSDGIFKCFDSMTIFLITLCCPCIQLGLIVRRAFPSVGFVKPCVYFIIAYLVFYVGFVLFGWSTNPWMLLISAIALIPLIAVNTYYRTKIRNKYEIPGSFVFDFILLWFCWPCALCQESRHIERDYAMPV